METESNKAVDVCQKLLEILEKEKKEISAKNLDSIEHYCSLKMGLIKELDDINKEVARTDSAEKAAKVEPLLKKIIELNESNAEAVRNMKKDVLNEITTGHKQSKAFKAYNP